MSKQKENLLKRLQEVSKNNVAYIEAFGAEIHWGEHKKRIEALEKVSELRSEVEKLENALKAVNVREEINKKQKELKQKALKSKLEKLGLDSEDLEMLGLKVATIGDSSAGDDPIEKLRNLPRE